MDKVDFARLLMAIDRGLWRSNRDQASLHSYRGSETGDLVSAG
jgi:hypothetical protein